MSQDSSDKNIVAQSLQCLDDEEEEEDEGYDHSGGFSKKALNALNGKHFCSPSLINNGGKAHLKDSHQSTNY